MVFQNAALFDSLTVGENVGFLLYEHSQLPPEDIERIVEDSLSKVGLRGVQKLFPNELSGGMKKRVALARWDLGRFGGEMAFVGEHAWVGGRGRSVRQRVCRQWKTWTMPA
eukprot:351628-Chlamydomonas_euryale.AAC.7